MILLSILAVTLLILVIFCIFIVGTGSAIFIIVFADVIVCIGLILWVINRLLKRKRR